VFPLPIEAGTAEKHDPDEKQTGKIGNPQPGNTEEVPKQNPKYVEDEKKKEQNTGTPLHTFY